MEVTQTDALTVSQAIRDVPLRCDLQLGQCRGQAYDGASNMSGRFSGVAIYSQPKAHYIHCMAYCLNLCLQECGSQCHIVRDALHLVADLSNLIHSSPKRLGLFLEIRDTVNPQAPGLKILCLTRWDSTNTCHRYKEL